MIRKRQKITLDVGPSGMNIPSELIIFQTLASEFFFIHSVNLTYPSSVFGLIPFPYQTLTATFKVLLILNLVTMF